MEDLQWADPTSRELFDLTVEQLERLPKYRAKCAGWQIFPMQRHDCLPAGIGTMPQEMMRSLSSNDLETSPLQRRNDSAAGQRRQCSHESVAATCTS